MTDHEHQWVTVSGRWEERREDGRMHEVYAPGESKTFCALCSHERSNQVMVLSRRRRPDDPHRHDLEPPQQPEAEMSD